MRALLATLALLLVPATAAADGPRLDVSTGMFVTDAVKERGPSTVSQDPQTIHLGLSTSALLTVRLGAVQLGGMVEGAGALFGPDFVRAGLAAGPVIDLRTHQRIEIFVEGGYEWIYDIGSSFEDDGIGGDTTATMPFVGVRAGFVGDIFSEGRWSAGAWITYRRELDESENVVIVEDCFIGCDTETKLYDIGGSHWGVIVSLGYR